MSDDDHQCKDGSEPSPLPWKIHRRTTPFHDWIGDASGGVVCTGFGTSDETLLLNARHAHDACTVYRDTLNTVRRRLLDLADGRNPAAMRTEAAAVANLIHTRLQTPERGHSHR